MQKKTKIKSPKIIKELRSSSDVVSSNPNPYPYWVKVLLVVLFGSLVYLVAAKYKNLFIAGTVNTTPITRWELNKRLATTYGKQVFEEMVNEKLLAAEISKNKIVVTDEEVKVEVDKLIKQYGGEEAFKNALSQYNLTEDKAKESIKQSLSFKKLVEATSKIEITDEAVKKYYDDNKASFTGKKLEEVSTSIKDSLYQQELFAKSQEFFSKVRQSAKVNSFI